MKGIELSRLFYRDLVRPWLDRTFPGLRHDAGLFGYGSELLGFDDDIADIGEGLQILRRDVLAAGRERLVDAVEHAERVAVDMDVARAGGARRQLHLREIHRADRRVDVRDTELDEPHRRGG